MASLIKNPDGSYRVEFTVAATRQRIHLSKTSKRLATAAKSGIEGLVRAKRMGDLPDEASVLWARRLDAAMRTRLARAGLYCESEKQLRTIRELVDEFLATISVKPSTLRTYQQTADGLCEFFGQSTLILLISESAAKRWRNWMVNEKNLAQPTVSKRVKTARQIFALAKRWRLVLDNPFEFVKAGTQQNRERIHFVSREEWTSIRSQCPDVWWRLIVDLSRIGGLRCPSEVMGVRWGDMQFDLEKPTIWVRSPKTAHREGKQGRMIPMYPELMATLVEAFANAQAGSEYVIEAHRLPSGNLRTQFGRMVRRAGLTPWPRLFQNLRASRQQELSDEFPEHVVCEWMGNTKAVAAGHYLKPRDEHFRNAAGLLPAQAQKVARHMPESRGNDVNDTEPGTAEYPANPSDSATCPSVPHRTMTPAGFEPASRP